MKEQSLLQFSPSELEPALSHIESHWQALEKFEPKDTGTLIGLPKPYLVPSSGQGKDFGFEEMYYWDSYFTAVGLLGTTRQSLAFGMLENLKFLIKRFGMVPNGGRIYLTSHSQPPFLTSFIMDLFAVKPNTKWLQNPDALGQKNTTSMDGQGPSQLAASIRGLSRYYDTNLIHDLAEAESGWDMTTRFNRQCLNYVPVDLNALLFLYEKDFERTAEILNEPQDVKHWAQAAAARRINYNKYLWKETEGFYFDYNYVKGESSPVWSLAGYYPLWAGMASTEQARRLVENLKHFEYEGGLSTTALHPKVKSKFPTQWSHPNGWAPLHLIVAYGLDGYGFNIEAQRIVRKWLRTNLNNFNKHGVFFEKYNVVHPDKAPKKGIYPSQSGLAGPTLFFTVFCVDFLQPHELPELSLNRKQKAANLISGAERQLRRFKSRIINNLPYR